MGRYSSDNRQDSRDIYSILAEREAMAAKKKAAPGQPKPPVAQAREPVAPQPVKKAPRKGTKVFWLSCLIFVAVFYVATFIGLQVLKGWLVKFEAAQPTVKSQEVFAELFAKPDWKKLYETAGLEAGSYEDAATFAAFMEARVGGEKLTFLETSAGLSGDKKYVVCLGDEKLGTFTLEDKNGAKGMTAVPDWQLSDVTFFASGQESFRILMAEGNTAYINGIALTEDQIVARRTSQADAYLPTFAPKTRIQILEVAGLLTTPVVEIRDADGQALEVTYDAETATFSQAMAQEELPEDLHTLALDALETYALYMSGKATKAQVGKYFDKNSETYASIMAADLAWVQKGSDYTFTDKSVTDYRTHGEEIFSVRVSVDLNITRKEDGTVKTTDITQSMFFAKNSSGDWVCFEMTAVDASVWLEEVRLVFLKDGEVISDTFVDSESSSVTCPLVSVPEGKTFKGWTVEEKDGSGKTVLRLMFSPDESGVVNLPSGTVLTPMTLSPLVE